MRWGDGKLEVTALRGEILALLGQGYTVKRIHEELVAAGKIQIRQRAFYDHVNTLRSEAAREKAGRSAPHADARPAPLPISSRSSDTTAPTAPPDGLPPRVTYDPQASPDLIDQIWNGEAGQIPDDEDSHE